MSTNNTLDPVNTWYGWLVVGLTLVVQAVSVGIVIYSFALFVVPWLEAFESSRSEIMLIIFSLQIMVGVLSPVCGGLLDRYSMRVLLTVGGCCIALGLLLISQASHFWQVALVYASLLPLGMVLAGPMAAQTLISKWFHGRRGLAMGVSSMGTSIGGFAFPLVTAQLIENKGWEEASIVLAAVSVAIVVPACLWILRRSPPDRVSIVSDGSTLRDHALTNRQILSSRRFWIPVIGLIPVNAAFGGVQFNLGAYMKDLGHDQSMAASLISVTAVSMILGKLFFGGLGDRVDHRKLYWLMAFMLTVSLGLFLYGRETHWLAMAALFQGLATGGVLPMMGIMVASRFDIGVFGRVLGLFNLFLMIGSFGSIFSGYVFDITGSYSYAFIVFMLLILPASLAMYWLPEKD